jgi:hypothetical protein
MLVYSTARDYSTSDSRAVSCILRGFASKINFERDVPQPGRIERESECLLSVVPAGTEELTMESTESQRKLAKDVPAKSGKWRVLCCRYREVFTRKLKHRWGPFERLCMQDKGLPPWLRR